MTNDKSEANGVKSADEHIGDSTGANVTYETSLETGSRNPKRDATDCNYLLGNVIAFGHLDA